MSYWTFNGEVGLKGVDGVFVALDNCRSRVLQQPDPENPARLDGDVILYALRTSRRARDDFRRLFPTLLPEEQARLTLLLESHPRASELLCDPQKFYDTLQSRDVSGTLVYTNRPRGVKSR